MSLGKLDIADDRVFAVDGPNILLRNPSTGIDEVIHTREGADALANAYAQIEKLERLKDEVRGLGEMVKASERKREEQNADLRFAEIATRRQRDESNRQLEIASNALEQARTKAKEASALIPDEAHQVEGCRFTGTKNKAKLTCFACLTQDKLGEIWKR